MKNKKIDKYNLIIIILVIAIIVTAILLLFNNNSNNNTSNNDNSNNNSTKQIDHVYTDIYIQKLEFKDNITELEINSNYQTTIHYEPSYANHTDITYETTTPTICTISINGLITTLNKGTCTITAKSDKVETNLTIEIINSKELKSISTNNTSYNIEVDKENEIEIIMDPINAEYTNVTCTSSNTNIFTVTSSNNKCILTGIKSGNGKLNIKVDSFETNIDIISNKKVKVSFASFNIGRGYKYSNLTYTDFANYIKDIDIIGVQEARDSKYSDTLVKNIASYINKNYYFGTKAPAGNAVISKYNFVSKSETKLTSKSEQRTIIKTVFNINNVNISFYTTHIVVSSHDQSGCTYNATDTSKCPYRVKELNEIKEIIQKDSNPVVLLADWNFIGDQYFSLLGNNLEMVAYDTIRNKTYDSIWIIPKGKLEKVSNSTIETRGKVTDHNLVIAYLNVIN